MTMNPKEEEEEETAAAAGAAMTTADDGDWRKEDFLSFERAEENDNKDDKDNDDDDDSYDSMDESFSSSSLQSSSLSPLRKKLLPPWIERNNNNNNNLHRLHPLTALHNEIVWFTQLMEPLPSEMEQRDKLVEKIRNLVRKHLADLPTDSSNQNNDNTTTTTDPPPSIPQLPRIQVFGSQATGLFLPSSDIDCVVITTPQPTHPPPLTELPKDPRQKRKNPKTQNEQQEEEPSYALPKSKSPLRRFAQAIRDEWGNDEALTYLETIENTRIPLVKFRYEGIQVDVCFNQYTGPPAAKLMKEYLQEMPPLRPLTFVLKYFLAARELNEPYTGGVGSYMLQLMIVAFLQQRERYAVNVHPETRTPYNLGTLLLEFLELYGEQLNYYTTGISVRHDGFFFPKGARDRKDAFFRPDKPAMLAIENPLDPTQDVGMSSFRYQMVQRAFAVACKTLLALVTASPQYEPELIDNVPSRLAEILPPTPYMTSRLVLKRRDRPLAAKRKHAPDEYHATDRNQKRQNIIIDKYRDNV